MAAQTLAGHFLTLSLSVSHSLSLSVCREHTVCVCVCVCNVCMCVRVYGVRPPLFTRAQLHFSAAYLLHGVFIQSTSLIHIIVYSSGPFSHTHILTLSHWYTSYIPSAVDTHCLSCERESARAYSQKTIQTRRRWRQQSRLRMC